FHVTGVQTCALPICVVLCSLRDPFEVARAFHTQMVFTGFEPVDDFVAAWDLQAPRRARPEPACPVPRLLQYAEVVAFGSQLRARSEERRVGEGWGAG